jgi:hypothetical protein
MTGYWVFGIDKKSPRCECVHEEGSLWPFVIISVQMYSLLCSLQKILYIPLSLQQNVDHAGSLHKVLKMVLLGSKRNQKTVSNALYGYKQNNRGGRDRLGRTLGLVSTETGASSNEIFLKNKLTLKRIQTYYRLLHINKRQLCHRGCFKGIVMLKLVYCDSSDTFCLQVW